ncbi:hypothetical protein PGQ11_009886 [Apiospora arundinis]|uniref:C2H2-type domain-containing protein n=1 Tax=Apiospora arundinis TaxID=335852 RepID=A0ABR2I954_9PEZI
MISEPSTPISISSSEEAPSSSSSSSADISLFSPIATPFILPSRLHISSLAHHTSAHLLPSATANDQPRHFRCDEYHPGCPEAFQSHKDLNRHLRSKEHHPELHGPSKQQAPEETNQCACGMMDTRPDNHKRHVSKCHATPILPYRCAEGHTFGSKGRTLLRLRVPSTAALLLGLLVAGTLIRRLGARKHVLGVLDVLVPDVARDGLERLGREPAERHLVAPRRDRALPLLLEQEVGAHALRLPLDADRQVVDVELEIGDGAEDRDQGLGSRVDFRFCCCCRITSLSLLFWCLLLLLSLLPRDRRCLVPELGVLERQDAPPEIFALVVALPDEALDPVEVLDDVRVAAVLALFRVEELLLVLGEAVDVQLAEARLDVFLDLVQPAQRALAVPDLGVAELLFRVLVAPVAEGGRRAELGGALDLLFGDLLFLRGGRRCRFRC